MAKILIIDDDPSLRSAYEDICTKNGWEVITAGDGKAGLDAALKNKPDIILLDMLMPGMGGLDFLQHFDYHNQTFKPTIIVLTNSKVPTETSGMVKRLGASSYQIKSSLSPNELADLIKSYLK